MHDCFDPWGPLGQIAFRRDAACGFSVVYLVLRLLGFTIYAERITNVGRIDAVLELADKVYILEFKMTTGQIALDQIRGKQYAQPFLGGNKTVILLGMAFDKTTRNIADWVHEIVQEK